MRIAGRLTQAKGVVDLVGLAGGNRFAELGDYRRVVVGGHGRFPRLVSELGSRSCRRPQDSFGFGKQSEPEERKVTQIANGERSIEGGGGFVAHEAGGEEPLALHGLFDTAEAVYHLIAAPGLDDFARPGETPPRAGRGIIDNDLGQRFVMVRG